MGEEHLTSAVMGVGGVLSIAGTIQLFCLSIEIQRAKRGQIRVGLTFRNWSPRSIWRGVVMIAVGALLLGGPYFS
jgi:hypothetical protein